MPNKIQLKPWVGFIVWMLLYPLGASGRSSPLVQAMWDGVSNEAVNGLLDTYDFESQIAYGTMHALSVAVRVRNPQYLKILLDAGADVNWKVWFYEDTALHYAAKRPCVACVKLLIERGAEVNVRNRNGMTPLKWAVVAQNDSPSERDEYNEIIQVLLQAQADPDFHFGRPDDNSSALYLAAHYGHLRSAELLVEAGANLETRVEDPNLSAKVRARNRGIFFTRGALSDITPLGAACKRDQRDMALFLLESGALLDETAPLIAEIEDHLELAQELNTLRHLFHLFEEAGENTNVIRSLIRDRIKSEDKRFGKIVLAASARDGKKVLVQELVEAGIGVSAQVVRLALKNGHSLLAEFLRGVKLERQNRGQNFAVLFQAKPQLPGVLETLILDELTGGQVSNRIPLKR